MTTKSLFGAAAFALALSSPTYAATFDFSFDASTAISGDTSIRASGTLDIDVAPGTSFSTGDVTAVNISVFSAVSGSFTFDTAFAVLGVASADGLVATFDDFFLNSSLGMVGFGCQLVDCVEGEVGFSPEQGVLSSASFATPAAALSAFTATAQVSAVPLPAGGLLLLSGLAGVAGLQRRKKRTA